MTSHYPDRCFAFDQFGPLSIRPCHGTCRAHRKRPARLRATCHRTHGIRYFHGCHGVGDDQLRGVVRQRKGGDHTLAALKSIRVARPGGYRLFVIMDNLSADKTPAIRRWARRENVELCLTPASASRANPIEAQFGPLRTFVMGGSDHPGHPVLARKLQAYLRWRNASARLPTSWPPSAANAPASAANAISAGAAPSPKPHDRPVNVHGRRTSVCTRELGSRSLAAVLECAGNGRSLFSPGRVGERWDLAAVGNATWTGARLADVLDLAGGTAGSQRGDLPRRRSRQRRRPAAGPRPGGGGCRAGVSDGEVLVVPDLRGGGVPVRPGRGAGGPGL